MTNSRLTDAEVLELRFPPFGLLGGEAGKTGVNRLEHKNGILEDLGSTASVDVEPGDTFVIKTPGGGGFRSTN